MTLWHPCVLETFTFNRHTSTLSGIISSLKKNSWFSIYRICCLPHHFGNTLLPWSSWPHFLFSFLSGCFVAMSPILPVSCPQGSVLAHFILSFYVLFPLWPPTLTWFSLPVTPLCFCSPGSPLQLSLLATSPQLSHKYFKPKIFKNSPGHLLLDLLLFLYVLSWIMTSSSVPPAKLEIWEFSWTFLSLSPLTSKSVDLLL